VPNAPWRSHTSNTNRFMSIINESLSTAEIPSSWPELNDGMRLPRVKLLAPQNIYKFASRRVPVTRRMESPWWFAESDFKKLEPYLDLDSSNPGFVARIQGAVCYDWSDMDVLMVARLLKPMNVFQGPGKCVVERTQRGGTICYQPPQDLKQTFIPGIRTVPEVKENVRLQKQMLLAGPDEIDQAMKQIPAGKFGIMRGNPLVH